MPFSLLALIIFLIVYAIIAYGVYSSRKMQYDERQKYMQSIAYKYGFFTLILETAVMEPEKHRSCPSIHFSRRLRPECL